MTIAASVAKRLVEEDANAVLRKAIVTTVNSNATVRVKLSDSDLEIPYDVLSLDGEEPEVGNDVWLLIQGSAMFCLARSRSEWGSGGAEWEEIETIEFLSNTSSAIGNLVFDNIPSEYSQLRLVAPWFSKLSTGNGHIYFHLNGVSSAYGHWLAYHTTSSWSGTSQSSQAQGVLAYNYFYGGANRNSWMQADFVQHPGSHTAYISEHLTGLAVNGAPYGSQIRGLWYNTADIEEISIWTSDSTSWLAGSKFQLFGRI